MENSGQTDYKIVVVLNKKIDSGIVLNAAAHMAASIVAKSTDEQKHNMMFVDYIDGSSSKHLVSALSLVILRADNSNKLRRAKNEAIEKGLLYTDFLETMTQDSYVEQLEKTSKLSEEELQYWGICLFGKKTEIDPITRKFSLWR